MDADRDKMGVDDDDDGNAVAVTAIRAAVTDLTTVAVHVETTTK